MTLPVPTCCSAPTGAARFSLRAAAAKPLICAGGPALHQLGEPGVLGLHAAVVEAGEGGPARSRWWIDCLPSRRDLVGAGRSGLGGQRRLPVGQAAARASAGVVGEVAAGGVPVPARGGGSSVAQQPEHGGVADVVLDDGVVPVEDGDGLAAALSRLGPQLPYLSIRLPGVAPCSSVPYQWSGRSVHAWAGGLGRWRGCLSGGRVLVDGGQEWQLGFIGFSERGDAHSSRVYERRHGRCDARPSGWGTAGEPCGLGTGGVGPTAG